MDEAKTIQTTVRHKIALVIAVIVGLGLLFSIGFDTCSLASQIWFYRCSILCSLLAVVWLGLMQLWPSLCLDSLAWVKIAPFTLSFLVVIGVHIYLNLTRIKPLSLWIFALLIDIAYIYASTLDCENKSLLSRCFKPFRKEILTIIPISRPSTPSSKKNKSTWPSKIYNPVSGRESKPQAVHMHQRNYFGTAFVALLLFFELILGVIFSALLYMANNPFVPPFLIVLIVFSVFRVAFHLWMLSDPSFGEDRRKLKAYLYGTAFLTASTIIANIYTIIVQADPSVSWWDASKCMIAMTGPLFVTLLEYYSHSLPADSSSPLRHFKPWNKSELMKIESMNKI